MNANMLFLMMALSSSSSNSSSSSSNILETLLYTSNMFPETMRMLLAMNSAKARDDHAARDAEDLANRQTLQLHTALKNSNAHLTQAEVDNNPEIKALLSRLSQSAYDEIVTPNV